MPLRIRVLIRLEEIVNIMHRIYYYLFKLFNILSVKIIGNIPLNIKLRGRVIELPNKRQIREFYSILFKRLNLFNFSIKTTKYGASDWESLVDDIQDTPVHTVEISNLSAKISDTYDEEWSNNYNYILDIKSDDGRFSTAVLIFKKHPTKGILKLAILSRPDRHYGRLSYYKWISQLLFLFSIIYFTYKRKLVNIYYDGTVAPSVFRSDYTHLLPVLKETCLAQFNVVSFKSTFFNELKLFYSWPKEFKKFLWNNEIMRGSTE